ncbi:MAG: J domain-containing protein, partial [Armatimonadota bacterium]
MAQDHYRILGVSRNATSGDVKSAYRKIVLVHHPDKSNSKQSSEIFLKATEAYEILSDTDRRKHYDGNLDMRQRQANQPRPQTQTQARPQPQPAQSRTTTKVSTVAADVTKLTLI